jgi:rhomboid family protein
MFVSLRDRNSLKTIPFQRATIALILANAVIFTLEMLIGPARGEALWAGLGFTPDEMFAPGVLDPQTWHAPALITLLTHTFLHQNIWHLAGNMLFLWMFGDTVEDALGSPRFVFFYVLAGAAAALCEGLFGPNPDLPLIGASGAISGCIGAYLLLYPRSKIWILLFFRVPLPLPAYAVVGIWVATQIAYAVSGLDSDTAWFAHLGGFAAGALLLILMRKPGVRLFNPADPKPVPVLVAAKNRPSAP